MAKGGFSRTNIEVTQQRINKPHAEVQVVKHWGIEFCVHTKVKAATQRNLAIV